MISARDIRFAYAKTLVVDGVSLEIRPGECLALLGANGSGKSTLLKLLLKILKPAEGAVYLSGQDLAHMDRRSIARHLGYAEQSASIPDFSVFEAVLTGRLPHGSGRPNGQDIQIVAETIGQMQLDDLSQRRLQSLSGGQVQRVIIARALAQRPKVLLLDEPTNHLDMRAQMEVARQIVAAIQRFGIAALLVLHDVNLSLRLAQRLVFLKNGRVQANVRPEQITPELVEHIYDLPVEIGRVGETPFIVPRWLES
ncbi:MAG: ABC transporter ATP-binding protein [Wenzhouxiangella sp.]